MFADVNDNHSRGFSVRPAVRTGEAAVEIVEAARERLIPMIRVGSVAKVAPELEDRASRWASHIARVGNASKALVYPLVGSFALAAAVGVEQRPAGTTGVFRAVLKQPFGERR
jgi:hypothetical protein